MDVLIWTPSTLLQGTSLVSHAENRYILVPPRQPLPCPLLLPHQSPPAHPSPSQLTGHGTKQRTPNPQAAAPTPFFPAAFPFPFRLFVLSLGFSAAIPVLHTSA